MSTSIPGAPPPLGPLTMPGRSAALRRIFALRQHERYLVALLARYEGPLRAAWADELARVRDQLAAERQAPPAPCANDDPRRPISVRNGRTGGDARGMLGVEDGTMETPRTIAEQPPLYIAPRRAMPLAGCVTVANKSRYRPDGRPSVSITPPSALANHFKTSKSRDRDDMVALYAAWLDEQLADANSDAAREFARLRAIVEEHGSLTLLCGCAPLPCHGDAIRARLLGPA